MTTILPILTAVFAVSNITADYCRARTIVYITKPITTLLIIALASLACSPINRTYQIMVVIGLVFSLAGDVFLMLPEQPRSYFMPGLISFFLAHVCYIVGFSTGTTLAASQLVALAPFALIGVGLYIYLFPHLGPMKTPVLCYTTIIVVMAWRATVRLDIPAIPHGGALLVTIGAALFMASDACLAIARFARQFRVARAIILGTYFAAQTLIALSVYP